MHPQFLMVYFKVSKPPEGAKGRCHNNIDTLSAWAAAQAVADEVEVPCREVGPTDLDLRFWIYD